MEPRTKLSKRHIYYLADTKCFTVYGSPNCSSVIFTYQIWQLIMSTWQDPWSQKSQSLGMLVTVMIMFIRLVEVGRFTLSLDHSFWWQPPKSTWKKEAYSLWPSAYCHFSCQVRSFSSISTGLCRTAVCTAGQLRYSWTEQLLILGPSLGRQPLLTSWTTVCKPL